MADPANKTFEDFEKSTQGGASECPLGYGAPTAPQQNVSFVKFFIKEMHRLTEWILDIIMFEKCGPGILFNLRKSDYWPCLNLKYVSQLKT